MKTETGSLPTVNSCLGPSGKYSSGNCSITGQSGTVNATTNSRLASYGLTTQPALKTSSGEPAFMFAPLFYGEPSLLWVVQGSQDCIASIGRFRVEGAWEDGRSYGRRTPEGNTACFLSLKNL